MRAANAEAAVLQTRIADAATRAACRDAESAKQAASADAKLTAVRAQLASLQSNFQDAAKEAASVRAEMATARAQLASLQIKFDDIAKQVAQAHARRQAAEAQCDLLKRRLTYLAGKSSERQSSSTTGCLSRSPLGMIKQCRPTLAQVARQNAASAWTAQQTISSWRAAMRPCVRAVHSAAVAARSVRDSPVPDRYTSHEGTT